MKKTPFVYHLGAMSVTRIDETHFSLAPEKLFPDWDDDKVSQIERSLSSESVDLINRRVPLHIHWWVIEINGLTIIVDTGIGNGKSRPFSELFDNRDNPVLERFEAAGFTCEQVDYVLLTHLHVDHVGWNTSWQEGQWRPLFPNATYVFSQRECDEFFTPRGAPRRMVFEDSVLPLINASQVRTVRDEGEQILEGISFLPSPGHSIGHMAIEIQSQGKMALFSGDIMHSPLQVYRPEWSSMFCLEQTVATESRKWLLERAARTGATIFPSHFPETSAGTISKSTEGFEWHYLHDA